MTKPWKFIEVGNHEAVKIGELEKKTEAIKVVRSKSSNIRGVDELTHREEEAGMFRSSTPPMWWTMDGDQSWTKIGTRFVRPST